MIHFSQFNVTLIESRMHTERFQHASRRLFLHCTPDHTCQWILWNREEEAGIYRSTHSLQCENYT